MSAWTDLGLPVAQTADYRYVIEAALLRTPAETAQARQVRRHTRNKHTFTLRFTLTAAQVTIAEAFLSAHGFSWFVLPLVQGSDFSGLSGVPVRLVQEPTVSVEGHDRHVLQMTVEQLLLRSVFWSTTPYPLGATDEVAVTALPVGPLRGVAYETERVQMVGAVLPPGAAGTHVQTVWWNRIYNGGDQSIDIEEVGATLPASCDALLYRSIVWRYLPAQTESAGAVLPGAMTGTHEQTVFYVYIHVDDDVRAEAIGATLPSILSGNLEATP